MALPKECPRFPDSAPAEDCDGGEGEGRDQRIFAVQVRERCEGREGHDKSKRKSRMKEERTKRLEGLSPGPRNGGRAYVRRHPEGDCTVCDPGDYSRTAFFTRRKLGNII